MWNITDIRLYGVDRKSVHVTFDLLLFHMLLNFYEALKSVLTYMEIRNVIFTLYNLPRQHTLSGFKLGPDSRENFSLQ